MGHPVARAVARSGATNEWRADDRRGPQWPAPLSTTLRVAAGSIGASALAFGLLDSRFRDAEGYLTQAFLLPLSVCSALVLTALLLRRDRALFLSWLGLAMVGQALALQLMRAGNRVGYQHYLTPTELFTAAQAPILLLLVLQALAVGVAGRALWRRAAEWLATNFTHWRVAAMALVFVLTSATLSRELADYLAELGLASMLQLLVLATIVLSIASLPRETVSRVVDLMSRLRLAPTTPSAVERAYETEPGHAPPGHAPAGAETGGVDRFALVAALWVLAVTALLSAFAYQRHPHVPDEVIYLLHARYFAEGMLAMPAPPVPEAFNLDLMTYEPTRWYSPVPPGWPAVLAVGAFLGAAWLVNPVLAAGSVLLTYKFSRELYDRVTARWVLVLLCTSPWFLLMGMNYMTHTFTLACALVAALATARLRRTGHLGWAVLAGIALGATGLIRPLEGLTLAALLGMWAVFSPAGIRLLPVSVMALVSIATGAITFPYNHYFTGSATTFPLMAYTDAMYGVGTNALGFGPDRGIGWPGLDPLPGHGAIDVLVNANLNLYQVNVELLGWGAGSLALLALFVFSGRMRRPDRLMLLAIAAIVLVHSFYWFSGGPDFGARYWYLILVPCVVLGARGIRFLASSASPRAPLAALACCLLTVTLFIPWRAIDKYHHYRNMRPDVRHLAAQHEFGRSLVLVRGARHPDYASAATYNPIDLKSDAPIYVWDRDPAITRRTLEAYADRDVWILDGPTRTGAGFRVEAGPVRATDLMRDMDAAR